MPMEKEASLDIVRRRLGIKRLFQGNEEILLNGEDCIDAEDDGELQVRDDDGVTVLWKSDTEQFHADHVDKYNTEHVTPFDDSAIDEDIREMWSYRPFCINDWSYNCYIRSHNESAFCGALGIELFFCEESPVRGRGNITPIDKELIQHWRDLCDMEDYMAKIDVLQARVNKRTGETKRPRNE